MQGLMMNSQLLISGILQFAERNYPNQEIVSVTADNPYHRYTYKDCFKRTRQLANVLATLGATFGDRIGTLAWNDYRHLELYYAVSGSGMICHTINPKLYPEQIAYIINHAHDKVLFVDLLVMPLIEKLQEHLSQVESIVVMTDQAHMPQTSLTNVFCYETLLAGEPDTFSWPDFSENTASSMCYTSGTTGHPKGVLYSHRSTLLHSFASALPDCLGSSSTEVCMPIVPMFHVNAWGLPYTNVMTGTKLVFPGPKMIDPTVLHTLITKENVTCSAGVPTIWMVLLDYLDKSGLKVPSLNRVISGGAACPRSIVERFERDYDTALVQAWGMTETSPLGTAFHIKGTNRDLEGEALTDLKCKQGRGVFGVEMKIVDENNQELPWDGEAFGALKVRGPWVCSGYYGMSHTPGAEGCPVEEDGWMNTGDVATIDAEGYMQITDRTKDVIKSGGEWVSSIDIENAAVTHPKVAEAAAIGRYHPKWTERPLLVVVPRPDTDLSKDELMDYLKAKLPKVSVPDDIQFQEQIPHTATGKINKLGLRKQYENYQFSE